MNFKKYMYTEYSSFTSIYPNPFTSNVVHLYIFSKLFSQFCTLRLPGCSCMKVPTICSQRGGCDWQQFHPLTLDFSPDETWIAMVFFWPPKSRLVSRRMICLFMFLLTNHRPSKEAGFVSKNTCLSNNKQLRSLKLQCRVSMNIYTPMFLTQPLKNGGRLLSYSIGAR